jgi:hypothetical protein
MKQKVLVAIAIIALILGIINLILLLVPPQSTPIDVAQKIPLTVTNIRITGGQDYLGVDRFVIQVTLNLPEEIPTLFNCSVQAEYLTVDDVWKSTSKNIGIVNYGDYENPQLRLDTDFACEITPPSIGWQSYDGNNLKVEAYGYLKP